jgi:spore coat protein U-like protein
MWTKCTNSWKTSSKWCDQNASTSHLNLCLSCVWYFHFLSQIEWTHVVFWFILIDSAGCVIGMYGNWLFSKGVKSLLDNAVNATNEVVVKVNNITTIMVSIDPAFACKHFTSPANFITFFLLRIKWNNPLVQNGHFNCYLDW